MLLLILVPLGQHMSISSNTINKMMTKKKFIFFFKYFCLLLKFHILLLRTYLAIINRSNIKRPCILSIGLFYLFRWYSGHSVCVYLNNNHKVNVPFILHSFSSLLFGGGLLNYSFDSVKYLHLR